MTTIEHLETLLLLARHIAAHGGPVESARAAERAETYERALATLRRLAP